jgi:hypothetical protein
MALSCRCSSRRPALKERGPTFCPCLLPRSVLRLGQHDHRAYQFVGAEAICPGGDDEFAELLHLAALEIPRLVLKCFQFSVEIPWLRIALSSNVDGVMIVEPWA